MIKSTSLILLASLLGSLAYAKSDHWAVLVAGSSGYWNYRHQADVCHAYHLLRDKGEIPEDQIIVFAYDDIASNPENKFKGKLFNKPNGKDVYQGCKIDYNGTDVQPEHFLKVLEGDHKFMEGKGSGKVLNTTSESKVFVFFTDHGATGILGFPDTQLYADQLIASFKTMHQNKRYDQMVVYIEACESGSIFEGKLEDNLNIYVMTASNAFESSWATYCYPDDLINGEHLGTCLGDLFSVNWMEDSDQQNLEKETLLQQFEKVKNETDQSHVMQYGQLTFIGDPIGYFQANFDKKNIQNSFDVDYKEQEAKEQTYNNLNEQHFKIHQGSNQQKSLWEQLMKRTLSMLGQESQSDESYFQVLDESQQADLLEIKQRSSIKSRDAKLHYLFTKMLLDDYQSHLIQLDFQQELNYRQRVDHIFEEFRMKIGGGNFIDPRKNVIPQDFECLRAAISIYKTYSGQSLDEYEFQYVRYFVQACEVIESEEKQSIIRDAIIESCTY
eukprot:403366523